MLRFQRERQILATLSHPHICRLLDGGSLAPNNRPYLVMEYVKGYQLHEYCDRKQHGFKERTELLIQLCGAVEAFHQGNVVHRDLSPNNVMTTEDGSVKVMDFGLATFLVKNAEMESDEAQSRALGVGVTLPFASPEQVMFDGTQTLGVRTDIYMLGSLMYRLLCGQPPFDGLSRREQIDAICSKEPLRPRRIKPNMPLDLETVCLKCLEKNPESRYENARALREELERFLRNEPVKARRPSIIERTNRWRQRNPVLFALAIVLFAVVAAGVGSTGAALRQAWAFQTRSQDVLGKLGSALTESFFLNPSAYTFDEDFRDVLSLDMATYAEDTVKEVTESRDSRSLLAAMQTHLAIQAFNDQKSEEGMAHYKEGLRLWREALRDDPSDTRTARSLAIALAFYADSQKNGVAVHSDLEASELFPDFSYRDSVDRTAASAIATLWNQRIRAFAGKDIYGPSDDAYVAAVRIWTRLLEQDSNNADYRHGLAIAHLRSAESAERRGVNYRDARIKYGLARQGLLELRALEEFDLADLELLATVTWNEASVTMRYTNDWREGRALLAKAILLGVECRNESDDSMKSNAFLTEIQWSTIEHMPPAVSPEERLELITRCRNHIVGIFPVTKRRFQDDGILGACQYLAAHARKHNAPREETREQLNYAIHNLSKALEHDDATRTDAWRVWSAKVQLEFGRLGQGESGQSPRECYQSARDDAVTVIRHAPPDIEEALAVFYYAKDELQALDNSEGKVR